MSLIDESTLANLDLHLVVDNYATCNHPAVETWLAQQPRVQLHGKPTSSSWLNLVERFLDEINRKRIGRGVCKGIAALEVAIHRYLARHNDHPKPLVRTAKPSGLLHKACPRNQVLELEH